MNYKLPEILKEKMRERNLTQSALAKDFGFVQQTIQQYCSGKNEPDFKTAKKLADYFNISLDELITGSKYELKEIREYLGFTDNELKNLKEFSFNPLAQALFEDKKFAEIFSAVITSLSINFNSVKNVINSYGNSLTPEAFNDLILTQAVNTLDNYFREFFKEKMPFLQAQAHERAKSILSAMPEKVE